MYIYRTTKLGWNRKWRIQYGGLHPWNAYILATRLKRTWYHAKVLQRVHSITFWTWNKFSGLTVAILDFWFPPTWNNIVLSAIELAILENMVGAFGISILSCLLFNECLANIDWHLNQTSLDADVAYDNFISFFSSSYNECFPIIHKRVRAVNYVKPWITPAIIKSTKRKNYLYKKWILKKSTLLLKNTKIIKIN